MNHHNWVLLFFVYFCLYAATIVSYAAHGSDLCDWSHNKETKTDYNILEIPRLQKVNTYLIDPTDNSTFLIPTSTKKEKCHNQSNLILLDYIFVPEYKGWSMPNLFKKILFSS